MQVKYILITPARNEEENLRRLYESVSAQEHLPERWIIVDDGSTDGTPALVDGYAERHDWIEVVHRPESLERSFAGKVHAFNAGLERIRERDYEVVGNLDADLSFEPDYLQFLMKQFAVDPNLGVAGTPFLENGYDSAKDSFEGENHVAGGCQLFRRRCFEEIGGYIPNRAGGIDWIAVTTARMKGWRTRSFQEKRFLHYRPLGTAERGVLKAAFSYGEKDYYLGNSPVWQVFRFAYRSAKKPLILGGMALFLGYVWAAVRRIPRPVTRELMHFHRKEQMAKLRSIVCTMLRLKKVDSFVMASKQDSSS